MPSHDCAHNFKHLNGSIDFNLHRCKVELDYTKFTIKTNTGEEFTFRDPSGPNETKLW